MSIKEDIKSELTNRMKSLYGQRYSAKTMYLLEKTISDYLESINIDNPVNNIRILSGVSNTSIYIVNLDLEIIIGR
tara:strand:- start:31871 stop:32098 length:228 start_codon:yes stop_codon:yes gene_type:complete